MPIVAAVDTSDESIAIVEQARDLADAYGTELHVAHVENFSVGNLSNESNQDSVDVEDARAEATDVAADVAGRVLDRGEFEAVGLVGEPVEQLLEYSAERDAEYVVVGGRKQSPVGKALFGSVTQSLLLNADRPIVTVMHDTE